MSTTNLISVTGDDTDVPYLVKISNEFEEHATKLYSDLKEAEDALVKSPSDPAILAKYQAALQEYTTDRNTQASVIKKYADTVATMLQKLA